MYEKQSRNTNRSTDTIASFLLKTYQILQHPQYQRMISWDKSNVGFIIHDVVSFTRQILPKYFRHSNFSSFVRQLNMYDFHKVKQQNDSLVFKNPLFCKGQQHNLKFIRRKAAKKIGGQRRQQINQKNDLQNQKYQNLLKGFKKSIQSEINQSSLFYERSIQLIKDLNQSNRKKVHYISKLYVNDQKSETTEQIQKIQQNNLQSQNENIKSDQNQQTLKKDTVIRIPKQFLSDQPCVAQERNGHSATLSLKKIIKNQPQNKKLLNVDNMIILKQEIYKSLGNISMIFLQGTFEHWLNDYIQIQKKKIKYVNGYKNQLIKCRQTNKENYQNIQRVGDENISAQMKNGEYNQNDAKEEYEEEYNQIQNHSSNNDSQSNNANHNHKIKNYQNQAQIELNRKNDIKNQNNQEDYKPQNYSRRLFSFRPDKPLNYKIQQQVVKKLENASSNQRNSFFQTFKNLQTPFQNIISNQNKQGQKNTQNGSSGTHNIKLINTGFGVVSPSKKHIKSQSKQNYYPLQNEQSYNEYESDQYEKYQKIDEFEQNSQNEV